MSATPGTRRGLRPDTFPFLAVLLCAMGSLILLLLVMDRRAKAVARAKAQQASLRVVEEVARAAAARQAEWERRRAELRALLQLEEAEVQAQLQHVHLQRSNAEQATQNERARRQVLTEQLRQEQARLREQETAQQALRARTQAAAQQSVQLHADRARLTAELEGMERTLADLKLLRQRQQQLYSVVPYRGKQGDNRRPLYLECTEQGLVFHPERKTLTGSELTPAALRAEVEQRLARQKPTTPAANPKPYLLFLVRPNGIATYYRAQAGLVGLTADFGYELIDAAWVLDFPEDDAAALPWRTADIGKPARAGTVPAETLRGFPQDQPTARGSGASNSPPGSGGGGPPASSLGPPRPGGQQGHGQASSGHPSFPANSVAANGQPPTVSQPAPGAVSLAPPSLLGGLPRDSHAPPATSAPGSSEARASAETPPQTGRPAPRGLTAGDAAPTRRVGARDWVIAIECRNDVFVLYPGEVRIPQAALAAKPMEENALVQAVREELARRLARDAAARPQVRFLVRPDGVRGYYRAFPLLDSLGLPMTRQNLEANEEIAVEHLTR